MADAHLSRAELVAWRDDGTGDRDRLVSHLATCSTCRHLAAELERERPLESTAPARFQAGDFIAVGRDAAGAGAGATATRAQTTVVPRPVAYLAAAAGVVLAIVVLGPGLGQPDVSSTERGADVTVQPIAPNDATVSADSLSFSWNASTPPGALRLVVTAVEAAGPPVIDRPVTGTRYAPTADERQRLERGREYYWFVEYAGGGTGSGTSAAARFRVE